MGTEGTVLGVVIAVVGVIGSVLVARVSAPKPQTAGAVEVGDGPPVLEVAPEIFTHFAGRIRSLENKVDNLTAAFEAQTVRVSTLEKHLRQAMRLLRSAHRQLREAGTDPEPVPPELIPYSID
ncbi:hypothetical protein ABZY44_36255 [Streptomyces sp. NPDC006544]|uniref:hypothetical protein n=1 Tax=Streptomyces sp. NPDC006544 TaxID=3154583 RepID=UPI0033AA23F9